MTLISQTILQPENMLVSALASSYQKNEVVYIFNLEEAVSDVESLKGSSIFLCHITFLYLYCCGGHRSACDDILSPALKLGEIGQSDKLEFLLCLRRA